MVAKAIQQPEKHTMFITAVFGQLKCDEFPTIDIDGRITTNNKNKVVANP